MTCLAAWQPADYHGIGHVLPCCHVHDSANVQHDNQLLPFGMESLGNCLDKPHLVSGQQKTELVKPVLSFTEDAPYGDDGLVSILGGLSQNVFGWKSLGRTFSVHEPLVELAVDSAGVELFVFEAVIVEVVCGLVKSESRVRKPLLKVDYIRAVDVSGSCASGDELVGSHSEQCDR